MMLALIIWVLLVLTPGIAAVTIVWPHRRSFPRLLRVAITWLVLNICAIPALYWFFMFGEPSDMNGLVDIIGYFFIPLVLLPFSVLGSLFILLWLWAAKRKAAEQPMTHKTTIRLIAAAAVVSLVVVPVVMVIRGRYLAANDPILQKIRRVLSNPNAVMSHEGDQPSQGQPASDSDVPVLDFEPIPEQHSKEIRECILASLPTFLFSPLRESHSTTEAIHLIVVVSPNDHLFIAVMPTGSAAFNAGYEAKCDLRPILMELPKTAEELEEEKK